VRVCVQCGLSIGETATFCQVCGTRAGDGDMAAVAVAAGAPLQAMVTEPGAVSSPGFAAELDAVPVTGHSSLLDAVPDAEGAQLVADLATEHESGNAVAPEPEAVAAPEADETSGAVAAPEAEETSGAVAAGVAEAVEGSVEPEVAEEPQVAEAPVVAVPEPAVVGAPVESADDAPVQSAADARERRMAEIAALLEFGSRCEEANPARAAVVYGEVVVGCLEVNDDPLSSEPVRRDLVKGFDRLSFVLERQGLPDEALAVVDDAAALGLLDGADGVCAAQRGSLRDRREGLRRQLYGDWAQL
jgi:hypothetical protein